MNGAGAGGRLVTRRVTTPRGVRAQVGRSQLGNREQRRYDLRAAFGMNG